MTVLVAFRNREPGRIRDLFLSLSLRTKAPFGFVVVDYGSRDEVRSELSRLSEELGFRVVWVLAQGLPWNKAHALNIGARTLTTPWVVIIDADMVFADPILDRLLAEAQEDELWLLESIWPQHPRHHPLKGQVHRSPGVFQWFHRSRFEAIDGYCEDFEFWGSEDSDWVWRMTTSGCRIRWLSRSDCRLTHTWHPWENTSKARPLTGQSAALETEVLNGLRDYRNPGWGREFARQDRPILDLLGRVEPVSISLDQTSVSDVIRSCRDRLSPGALLKFDFGPRVRPRRLTRWAPMLLRLQDILGAFSLKLDYRIETRLEIFLLLRKSLGPASVDVYLTEDRTQGFLCVK